ncbi:MAG: hypothetical protein HY505_00960 [Candidatus Yanofskybacteria bacterium]|nr:hypothetical protein [Candidatus Yanofskybacteria bacterium]
MDANTQIWLGFRADGQGELVDVLAKLPEELYDELQVRDEVVMNGLRFKMFKHADDPVGFGIELLDQGWRDGPTVVDLPALVKRIQNMMPSVVYTLKTIGITNEPHVWLATNL